MAKIRLTSFYHSGKTHGKPGDVIECPDDVAQRIQSGRGGVILADDSQAHSKAAAKQRAEEKAKASKKQITEKATDSKAADSEKSDK